MTNPMYKLTILFGILIFLFVTNNAFAQEPKLATFQETAQLIIDKKVSSNVTASISLQTSSNQEIRITSELVDKIHESQRVLAVILTNDEQCVLGVLPDQSCIMINFSGQGIEGGIEAIQEEGRSIGNSLIDDINEAFDTSATFHSVYVHHRDEVNQALETSGVISGKGTVSAVYTLPKESTSSMYEKITAILLPQVIRNSDGFFEVAKNLSDENMSQMTISIIPQDNITLFQIKLSVDYPESASVETIDPLSFFKTESLKRSDYFSQGFYPLNSLLKIVVLFDEPHKVGKLNSKLVPTVIRDGERFPEFTNAGWFFDSDSGPIIEGTYLFGKKFEVGKKDLVFSVVPINATVVDDDPQLVPQEFDFIQVLILLGIVMGAIGAIVYFLKGFRGKKLNQ